MARKINSKNGFCRKHLQKLASRVCCRSKEIAPYGKVNSSSERPGLHRNASVGGCVMVQKACVICGTNFTPEGRQTVCSGKCWALREKKVQHERRERRRRTVECAVCGTPFTTGLNGGGVLMCSPRCKHDRLSKQQHRWRTDNHKKITGYASTAYKKRKRKRLQFETNLTTYNMENSR